MYLVTYQKQVWFAFRNIRHGGLSEQNQILNKKFPVRVFYIRLLSDVSNFTSIFSSVLFRC